MAGRTFKPDYIKIEEACAEMSPEMRAMYVLATDLARKATEAGIPIVIASCEPCGCGVPGCQRLDVKRPGICVGVGGVGEIKNLLALMDRQVDRFADATMETSVVQPGETLN